MDIRQYYRKYQKPLKLAVFLMALAAGIGTFYWQTSLAHQADAGLWGIADAKESNVNSKVAGRVVALYVKEGDTVTAGQVLARIDADAESIQQRQAQAALAAQYAQIQQVALSSDSTKGKLDAALKQAQAQAMQAETAKDLAAKDEARYAALLQQDAVPQQTYDSYRSKLDQAQANYEAAQAAVDSAQSALTENEANQAAQEAARKQADALQSQVDTTQLNLGETEIRAPYDGVITQKFVEEGALIATTVPLFAIQDTADNWIDFPVKETELGPYQVGDTVTMQGRNGEYVQGTIESIRRKADFATQKATSERGETDVMAFNVRVRTNNSAVWPGMRFKLLGKASS